jgi:hypothetical protein
MVNRCGVGGDSKATVVWRVSRKEGYIAFKPNATSSLSTRTTENKRNATMMANNRSCVKSRHSVKKGVCKSDIMGATRGVR